MKDFHSCCIAFNTKPAYTLIKQQVGQKMLVFLQKAREEQILERQAIVTEVTFVLTVHQIPRQGRGFCYAEVQEKLTWCQERDFTILALQRPLFAPTTYVNEATLTNGLYVSSLPSQLYKSMTKLASISQILTSGPILLPVVCQYFMAK